MTLATPTAAASSKTIEGPAPATQLVFKVLDGSAASLRIVTGFSIKVDGVLTADTTGLTVDAGESISLSASNTYLCSTATDATAADFQVIATR